MKTRRSPSHLFLHLLSLLILLGASGWAPPPSQSRAPTAETLYVDGQIGTASCNDYDVASRSCGGGSETAYATLESAAAAALPGDNVLIREGTYNEQLVPPTSGEAGSPITYRSYKGELPTITGSFYPAAIILDGVSYITIQGLKVEECRWLEATNAHHNIIRDNMFYRTPASGTTGNIRLVSSDHNQIVANWIGDGNDNLLLIDSDYNLVDGNVLSEGRHSVLSIRCASYNIIRNNYFSNSQQKIGEVYDCGEDTTIVPHAFDATQHNVIENNIFAEASSYYSTSGGNGIQYAGQAGIIRRNVFYHTNAGLAMQVYSDEALYNYDNRVYHNVFYDNECAGIVVNEDNVDNIFKNNILFRNKGRSGGDCANSSPGQVLYRGTLQGFRFERNNILNEVPGEAVIQSEFGEGDTLANFESGYPALFVDNIEADPAFTDVADKNFSLRGLSPMIDAGTFLAHAAASGSGTTLAVDDAGYFHNGFGIASVQGDLIQLEGQTQTARVIAVDYDAHTLTLDHALSWTADQGISLAYQGSAPDIGKYEPAPSLTLSGAPADQAIRLTWSVDTTLPPTSTWQIDYTSDTGTAYLPITGILSPTRAATLTELTNGVWYSVTLSAMLDNSAIMSDSVRVRPFDTTALTHQVYLPLVLR